MILLDNSIIFTGLPTIGAAMHLSPVGLSWVQDAYTLVFGGLLLLGARLGDLLGRRRVFVAGLAVFAAASLLVACAPTGGFLIAARALQGVGAAIVAPSSLSLLTASFPEGRERTRAVACVRRSGRHRRQPRPGHRRCPDQRGVLACRLLHQRADRHRDDRARPALPPPDPACEGPVRPGRRTGGDPGDGRARVRDRRVRRGGLVRAAHHRGAGRRGGVPRPARGQRGPRGPADHAVAPVLQPGPHRRLPGQDALPRRDDRVLLLHHPVPAGRPRLQRAAGRAWPSSP